MKNENSEKPKPYKSKSRRSKIQDEDYDKKEDRKIMKTRKIQKSKVSSTPTSSRRKIRITKDSSKFQPISPKREI
ncbi:Uncharacterized protein TCM_036682 [Theobroma cacao]|uniref:Uncharacterized protein n=1 Tax=Theobroma cacao TaxID=3641 RepID=A0A061FKP3_THECC|nr:Uncharacterized protein TCM_036682 [Theobroma cacao]